LAPNSELQLKTNRDGLAKEVTYSLDRRLLPIEHISDNQTVSQALTDIDQFLTVEPSGLVRSHSQLGRSVIMVTAKENFGINQMLSVGVEVSCVFLDAVDSHDSGRTFKQELYGDSVYYLFVRK
jgi:hypothetical protein